MYKEFDCVIGYKPIKDDTAYFLIDRFIDKFTSYGFNETTYFSSGGNARKERKDQAVEIEFARYYQQAKKILIENKFLLDSIAYALLDKQTLTHKDIKELKKDIF